MRSNNMGKRNAVRTLTYEGREYTVYYIAVYIPGGKVQYVTLDGKRIVFELRKIVWHTPPRKIQRRKKQPASTPIYRSYLVYGRWRPEHIRRGITLKQYKKIAQMLRRGVPEGDIAQVLGVRLERLKYILGPWR